MPRTKKQRPAPNADAAISADGAPTNVAGTQPSRQETPRQVGASDRAPRRMSAARRPAVADSEQPGSAAGTAGTGTSSDPGSSSNSGDRLDESEPSTLTAIVEGVESAAETVAQAVTSTTASLVRGAGELATGAARRFDERSGARVRMTRRKARQPLPVLWREHPGALNAPRRDLGLLQVPVELIRGTAVEGSQRGGDFRPIPQLRGANWEGRWRRIKDAMNRLAVLPPVDLLKTGDEYWVVDGHNRVAAANELGQVALDASVVELSLPGSPRPGHSPRIAQYLADDMRSVRAAGQGRHTRTAGLSMDLDETETLRRQFDTHADRRSDPTVDVGAGDSTDGRTD